MPNKKSNSSALLALAFAAVMIGVFFLNLTIWLKIAIDVLLILLFLFVRRGYIYFYRGALAMGNQDRRYAKTQVLPESL